MLKVIFSTALLFTALILGYVYYFSLQGMSFEAELIEKAGSTEYFPKENVQIKAVLANKGKKEEYFLINLKSQLNAFSPEVVYLIPNDSKILNYSFDIPAATFPGKYDLTFFAGPLNNISSNAPRKTLSKNIAITVKEIPAGKIEKKKPEPLSGNILFTDFPEKLRFNENHIIKFEVSNLSKRTGAFLSVLTVKTPDNLAFVSSSTLILPAMKTKSMVINYYVDENYTPGNYSFTFNLSDENKKEFMSSDTLETVLINEPPVIEGLITTVQLKPLKKINIVCKLHDDTTIENVKLYINGIKDKQPYTVTSKMQHASDSGRESIWETSIIIDKYNKSASFHVQAIDSKNAKTESGTYSIQSILNKK